MEGFYFTVPELIETLSQLDKRKWKKSPYVANVETFLDGSVRLTLVPSPFGGTTKKVILHKEGRSTEE